MMTIRLVLVVGLVLALAPGRSQTTAQATGVIRGRVSLPAPAPVVGRPAVGQLGASARPPVDYRAVVYLESAPRGAFAELQPGRARLDQRGEAFVPHVLAVTVGTVVDFPNSDTVFHNVFSLSQPRTFDLGRYAPGRSGAVRFDRPGIVPVFCDIHSHMSAYVLVFSHPFYAVSAGDGRYEIAHVPPGTYTLLAWSEFDDPSPRSIVVRAGAVTTVNFEIGGDAR